MSDISELQARIAAALDRIGYGVERLDREAPADPAGGDQDEIEALRARLAEEREASAALEDRVQSIQQTQSGTVERLSGEVARLTRLLATQEETGARLARANADLRANNAALRAAILEGVAEPHLVNKAMMAELEALRAAQGADRAEIEAILGELDAMIGPAAEGETTDA